MTHEQVVESILWPAWSGIPDNYKIKYARSIWNQFEDNIRSAAYTSSPARFFESLTRKLSINVTAADAPHIAKALASFDARELLKMLREETTLLVLLCRIKNQERREKLQKGMHNADEDLSVRDNSDGGLFDLA